MSAVFTVTTGACEVGSHPEAYLLGFPQADIYLCIDRDNLDKQQDTTSSIQPYSPSLYRCDIFEVVEAADNRTTADTEQLAALKAGSAVYIDVPGHQLQVMLTPELTLPLIEQY